MPSSSLDTEDSSFSQCHDIVSFPRELHLNILTFLRAMDLSALQRACRCFNHRDLVVAVVDHYANEVVSLLMIECLYMQCVVASFVAQCDLFLP